jgi:hypothetical protein
MIPAVILCIGIYWIPESPRWLISQDRLEEAWTIVSRLHSDPGDPQDEFAKREYYQMHKQIMFDSTLKSGYKELLTRPSYQKRIFITMALCFCVFSSGVLTIQSTCLLFLLLFRYSLLIFRLWRQSLRCIRLRQPPNVAIPNWLHYSCPFL